MFFKVLDISITVIKLFYICSCSSSTNSIKQMNHWADGLQPETRRLGQLDYFWFYFLSSHPVICLSDLLAHFHLILFSDHSDSELAQGSITTWKAKGCSSFISLYWLAHCQGLLSEMDQTGRFLFKTTKISTYSTLEDQCEGLTSMSLQYAAEQQVTDNLYQAWLMYWEEGWMETLTSS